MLQHIWMSWIHTCLSDSMTSCVVAVATMALLLPGLSCRDRESPDTNCTPSSVTLTLSSSTLMLLSASTDDVRGDSTCNTCKHLQTMIGLRWHCYCELRASLLVATVFENDVPVDDKLSYPRRPLNGSLSRNAFCNSFFEFSHTPWVPVVRKTKIVIQAHICLLL